VHVLTSALCRASFLPPLAIFARCCDSSNEMCTSMREIRGGFASGGSDVEIHEIFGLDQCDGSFVELGAGDGVIDSPTLLFEKNFGRETPESSHETR